VLLCSSTEDGSSMLASESSKRSSEFAFGGRKFTSPLKLAYPLADLPGPPPPLAPFEEPSWGTERVEA
jgi:hypothetical protein